MSLIKKINFYSNMLNKNMKMLVYLPSEYDVSASLPVLYFLHGRSGDENILYELNIDFKATQMIKCGIIKPLIIVCPSIENSRGINSSSTCNEIINTKDNNTINIGMYEDYFIKEVVPLVDKTFKTIRGRHGRYIGGISAGGYAALHYALRHQDMFTKVGGHMPAVELKFEDEDTQYFGNLATWEKYHSIRIVKDQTFSSDIDVYLDAGEQDEGKFYMGCKLLNDALKEKGINSQNHIFPGRHDGEYIKSNLEKYLRFYNSY